MRRISSLFVLMILGSMMVFATGQAETASTGEMDVLDYDVLFGVIENEVPDERPSLFDIEMRERFGINLVYQEVPRDQVVTKLNLLFAAGEAPDLSLGGGGTEADYNRWGVEGHIVPVKDYIDRVPDYVALYDPEAWDAVQNLAAAADGNLYYLPTRNPRKHAQTWLVREGTLEEMGLPSEIPDTVQEFADLMAEVKAADPKAVPMEAAHIIWTIFAFQNAFRTYYSWYYDPDSGQVEFGPATDKYRDMMIYLNGLYEDKLLEQELATISSQLRLERLAAGIPYFEYIWAGRVSENNQTMSSIDPDAGWDVAEKFPRAYEKPPLYQQEAPYWVFGPAIFRSMSEQKRDRWLEYLNWSATEEGQVFNSFGIEGVTFEYQGGTPAFMEHMFTVDNPSGRRTWTYGFTYLLQHHPEAYRAWGAELDLRTSNAIEEQTERMKIISWDLTVDQQKDMADIDTLLMDTFNKGMAQFIMGQKDPSVDRDWNEYYQELLDGGLEEAIDVRREVYATSYVY